MKNIEIKLLELNNKLETARFCPQVIIQCHKAGADIDPLVLAVAYIELAKQPK